MPSRRPRRSARGPSYAAYAVSFLVIGIIWVNHHGMFQLVGRVDRPLLFLNLALCFLGAWLRLHAHAELRAPRVGTPDTGRMLRRTIAGPVVYGVSIALAFVNAIACLVVDALLAAYFTVSYMTSEETSAAPAATPGGRPLT